MSEPASVFETNLPAIPVAGVLTPVAADTSARAKLQEKMMTLCDSDKRQIEQLKRGINSDNFGSIQEFAKSTINITNSVVDNVLKAAKSSSMDDIGGGINNILMTAKKIDASQLVSASNSNTLTRFLPWFFRSKERIVAQFSSLGEQIEKYSKEISDSLKASDTSIKTLEDMRVTCLKQYHQLDVVILTGRARAEELREEYEAEKIELNASDENDSVDALRIQELSKKEQFIDTLEKKVSNLEQMQQVVYLQIPQLSIMVKNAVDTRNEFQQIIDMTIPLWKGQFTQALLQEQQKRSSDLVKVTKDFTNNMLKKTAEDLKMTSIQIAEQGSRGLIDKSTLEHVQSNLIATVQGVIAVHNKAKDERLQISQSITQLKVDFKNSLQQI